MAFATGIFNTKINTRLTDLLPSHSCPLTFLPAAHTLPSHLNTMLGFITLALGDQHSMIFFVSRWKCVEHCCYYTYVVVFSFPSNDVRVSTHFVKSSQSKRRNGRWCRHRLLSTVGDTTKEIKKSDVFSFKKLSS